MPTAVINLSYSASLKTPLTVFADAIASTTDGYPIQDCLFLWDFGDPTPPNNGAGRNEVWAKSNQKAKGRFPDPRNSTSKDVVSRQLSRDVNTNTAQNGCVAAYTYRHAAIFTISLTVVTPAGSNSTTSNIVVANGGEDASWTSYTVNASGGADFTTLAAAVAQVNTDGNNRVIKLTAGQTHTVSSPITITATNVRIVSTHETSQPLIGPSGSYSNASVSSMLVFDGGGICIENIYFTQSNVSLASCNIRAITVSCADATIHNCYFENLYGAVITDSSSSRCYVEQCYVLGNSGAAVRSVAINFDAGIYLVASGNAVYSLPNSVTSIESFLIEVGGGSTVSGSSLQWNALRYNGTLSTSATTDDYPQNDGSNTHKGGIYIGGLAFGHVYQNLTVQGTNLFGKGVGLSGVRYDGNQTSTGGENAAHDVNSASGVLFINNVCLIEQGGPHAVGIYGSSNYGIDDVKVINNTFIISRNIKASQAVMNFTANGRSISDGAFVVQNNLFVDNRQVFSRYMAFSSASHIASNGIGGNVFPVRRKAVAVVSVNGVDYDQDEWDVSGLTTGDKRVTIPFTDMSPIYQFVADKNLFANVQFGVVADVATKDYLGTTRSHSASHWTSGAAECPASPFPNDSGASWTVAFTPVARTNRSDGALPGGVDGYNGYLTITDGSNSFPIMGGSGSGHWNIFDETNDIYGVGSNVKTEISVDTTTDGFDLNISYTNDGAGPQTSQSTSLGLIRLRGWDLGRLMNILDNRFASYFNRCDNYSGNLFNLAVYEYPYDKFSPNVVAVGRSYAVGISILMDFVGNDRHIRELLHCYTDIGGGLDSSLHWVTHDGTENKLALGESFSLTISVRLTRAPKQWIKTLAPYKAYFDSTYSTVAYARDPRPIAGLTAGILPGSVDDRFCFHNFNYVNFAGRTVSLRRPDHYGYGPYADNIRAQYIYNNFDRVLFWAMAGLYLTAPLNYPQRMFSPLFLTDQPQHDALINPNDLTTDTRGYPIVYPSEVPAGTVRPMFDTKGLFSRLAFDIPSMGYYFGRVGSLDALPWDCGVTTPVTLNNPSLLQGAIDEIDLGAAYLKGTFFGFDAFSIGNMADDLTFLSTVRSRHPNVGFPLTELQGPDIISRVAPGFVHNLVPGGINEPHHLANYLIPGHETWCGEYYHTYRTDIGGFQYITADDILCLMENVAQMGYTPIVFEDITLDDPSLYLATIHNFDNNTAPADYPTIGAPTGLYQTYHENDLGSAYSLKNTYLVIHWNANSEPDFDHYVIYKAKLINGVSSPGSGYVIRQYAKENIYRDSAVENGHTYYYKIKAVDVFGNESSFSDVLSAEFIANDPSLPSPSNVRRDTSEGLTSMVIIWNEDNA